MCYTDLFTSLFIWLAFSLFFFFCQVEHIDSKEHNVLSRVPKLLSMHIRSLSVFQGFCSQLLYFCFPQRPAITCWFWPTDCSCWSLVVLEQMKQRMPVTSSLRTVLALILTNYLLLTCHSVASWSQSQEQMFCCEWLKWALLPFSSSSSVVSWWPFLSYLILITLLPCSSECWGLLNFLLD